MTVAAAPLRRLLDRRFVLAVVVIWTLCRAITTVILIYLADQSQDPVVYDDSGVPRYFQFATLWDGAWYERIATDGYPQELPRAADGMVRQNPWAFYPIFPFLSRGLTALTGLPFAVTGTIIATLLGYAAAIVVAGLLREKVGRAAALSATVLLGTYPSAPTFQVAYTESLALLLLAAVLWLLVRRAWWAAAAVALLTGLARPIALPLGLVALVAVIVRWRRRQEHPITRGEYAGMSAALIGCGLAGLIWPMVAWWGTGERAAYALTMSSWRGGEEITPFLPTLERVQWLWGEVTGLVILAAGLALLLVAVLGPWAKGLGVELRTWCLGYVLYLFAALDPWTSIFRYLVLLFPLFVLLVGGGRGRDRGSSASPTTGRPPQPTWLLVVRCVVIALIFVVLQAWWSWELFRFVPPTDDPP
ncbi:MAG: hypothetical protein Q4P07_03000 [Ornithinimicrobium sp.]|nr:hypothetical protein [Ornithinimicrobium sp.]